MRTIWMAVAGYGALGLVGCHNAATRECLDLFTSAQGVVNKIDAKSQSSVEESLGAVERAMASCDAAGRNEERDSLKQADNELKAHLESLKERANRPKKVKLTPEQVQDLAAHGDPSCPKGQAYRDTDLKKEIRCTGPELVDMNWAQAKQYFDGRGYKVTTTDNPPTLKAEYGAELLVFDFASPNDTAASKCLSLYPPPGQSWQEGASRVTGVSPRKLDPTGTVTTDRGPLPIHVDNSDTKVLVQIGTCG